MLLLLAKAMGPRREEEIACYFLLNVVHNLDTHSSPLRENPDLAIFF